MPVLVAVRLNPWLRAYYWRLRGAARRPIAAVRAEEEIIEAADFRARQLPAVDKWVAQHAAL
jgi:hypothetical protein